MAALHPDKLHGVANALGARKTNRYNAKGAPMIDLVGWQQFADKWKAAHPDYYSPAAAAPAAPAAPAPTKPLDPFLRPDQQIGYEDALKSYHDQGSNIDLQVSRGEADRNFNISQTTRDEQRNKAATIEAMIARGLSTSSIKDGELYDIQSTAALRRQYFNDTFDALNTWAKTAKSDLGGWWERYNTAINKLKVENASAASAELPPQQDAPPPPPALAPPPAATAPLPQRKTPQSTPQAAPALAADTTARTPQDPNNIFVTNDPYDPSKPRVVSQSRQPGSAYKSAAVNAYANRRKPTKVIRPLYSG